jgi:hypothetical protein
MKHSFCFYNYLAILSLMPYSIALAHLIFYRRVIGVKINLFVLSREFEKWCIYRFPEFSAMGPSDNS